MVKKRASKQQSKPNISLADVVKNQQEQIKLLRQVIKDEADVEAKELKQLEELKSVEEIEKDIRKDMEKSALKKVTYHDLTKGIVGAFFGIVGHFAFAKGADIAAHLSLARATLLYLVAFILVIIFLYFTGFRKISDRFTANFLPVRAFVIYFSAIITTIIVLFLYNEITIYTGFAQIYTTIASVSILAVMGAGTADLLGRN